MSGAIGYAAAATVAVAGAVGLLWPFLDPQGRSGVLMAAAVALPLQVAAFTVLVRARERGTNAFLAAWMGGTVVRMAAVLGVGLLLLGGTDLAPMPTLLGLVGFFFGLLLLEPLFWGAAGRRTTDTNGNLSARP